MLSVKMDIEWTNMAIREIYVSEYIVDELVWVRQKWRH